MTADGGERRSEVDQFLQLAASYLDQTLLVSAYDLHYDQISDVEMLRDGRFARSVYGTPKLLLVDSGGYETKTVFEDSDVYRDVRPNAHWSGALHTDLVDSFGSDVKALLVNYDADLPEGVEIGTDEVLSVSYSQQIEGAQAWFAKRGRFASDFLLKPETPPRPHDFRNLRSVVGRLGAFDVIGVTEKELGDSVAERFRHLLLLRRMMDEEGVDRPIHVFGSLDPLVAPVYQMAGGEIFDGLTWLRYGYRDGMCVYKQAPSLLMQEFESPKRMWYARMLLENLTYLKKLEVEMRNFAKTGDVDSFRVNGEYMAEAHNFFRGLLEHR